MNKENKDNIPEDCRHCANDKDCYTYYGSNVCQNHWLKIIEQKSTMSLA